MVTFRNSAILRKLRNLKNTKIKKFALYFFYTVFHFLALYFKKIALLLANQHWEIFSCILLRQFKIQYIWSLIITLRFSPSVRTCAHAHWTYCRATGGMYSLELTVVNTSPMTLHLYFYVTNFLSHRLIIRYTIMKWNFTMVDILLVFSLWCGVVTNAQNDGNIKCSIWEKNWISIVDI